MRTIFFNLWHILKSPRDLLIGILFAWWLWWVISYFTDRALIAGNYGEHYALINLILDGINTFFFGLFVASFSYKRFTFSSVKEQQHSGWFWSILTAIVSGCPSCSITLATYLGLAGVLSALPFGGLEVKGIATVLLIWSVISNIKKLFVCSLPSK